MKPASSPAEAGPREASGPSPTVRALRGGRVLHRYAGLPLVLLIFVSSVTGVLLAWKKHSDHLQAPLRRGSSTRPEDWLPLARIAEAAEAAMRAHPGAGPAPRIDRLDVRPSQGTAKVLFKEGFWEVQVDLATARVLAVERRTSDFIEALHDGSIIGDVFKVVSMTWLGLGLLVLALSGLWLWYGARLVRRRRAVVMR